MTDGLEYDEELKISRRYWLSFIKQLEEKIDDLRQELTRAIVQRNLARQARDEQLEAVVHLRPELCDCRDRNEYLETTWSIMHAERDVALAEIERLQSTFRQAVDHLWGFWDGNTLVAAPGCDEEALEETWDDLLSASIEKPSRATEEMIALRRFAQQFSDGVFETLRPCAGDTNIAVWKRYWDKISNVSTSRTNKCLP